jgi:queuine tRNA-ribosyltransferase/7-cyano-7-deazaguanine tRNA-ribosyltransferase
MDSDEAAKAGSQALICNTYHLHIAPGEAIVRKAGGLHDFMHWNGPLMTDSGGFQVFSLGFGSDHGMGKMLKEEPERRITEGAQPMHIEITEDGVHFRSPVDGARMFLGPKESMHIQKTLGADITFAFDECPSPLSDRAYLKTSLERTHLWAKQCLDERNTKQALFGIVQGGAHKDLRLESARIIGAMPFEGFGIGGEFGYDKRSLKRIVSAMCDSLPKEKPRHLLGVGHPEDFAHIFASGIDLFDCIAPTHYGRHGTIFTSRGRFDLRKERFLKDRKPPDASCKCEVCKYYSRGYISHLLRSHELTGMKLASYHNLYFLNAQAAFLRHRIKNDDL